MPDKIHDLKNLVTHLEEEWRNACTLLDVLNHEAREAGTRAGIICGRLRAVRDAIDILERRG